MDTKKCTVKIKAETKQLDDVCEKVEKMADHLEKAMKLANSIALMDLDIRINAIIDNASTELAHITTE